MSMNFGKEVSDLAKTYLEQGKDANQIAKILCDRDDQGYNYGIGIILGEDGKPMPTSPTLLNYAKNEIENSLSGSYFNSNKIMEDVKAATLKWQRIPEKFWPDFHLALPSDAGTGAVKTAVEIALNLDKDISAIGIEKFGWPAYKAIAKTCRVSCEEFDAESIISGGQILPLYQAGPMNTTGQVKSKDLISERAISAAKNGSIVVLDRAYSGFEFARLIDHAHYNEIMQNSYELQIQPFLENGVTFCMALSPTKAFVTFALRPCGLLLVHNPDKNKIKETTGVINAAMRARGSSFEHSISRAFAKAMANDLSQFEQEHIGALKRLAQSEKIWKKLVAGTKIEYLYSENYAGLFRNPQARENADISIYGNHIYPVFSQNRCRQNITGIPSDMDLAKKHVAVFAEQCY